MVLHGIATTKATLLRVKMQKKTVHIVFQVLNYLHDVSSRQHKLLPIDKLLLITLASHKGIKGIFPMQETLADELGMTRRHLRNRIKFLEKIGLIFVEKVGRKHHYHLQNLSTIGEPQFLNQESIGELQYQNRGTTVPPIGELQLPVYNKVNNKRRTERGRASLARPLSDDFEVTKESAKKAKELGLTEEEANLELDKFFAYYQGKGEEKADWNMVLQGWFIRAAEYKAKTPQKKGEVRSTVKFYEPEPRTERRGDPQAAAQALGAILQRLKPKPNGVGNHGRDGQVEDGEGGGKE
jgi:biotin operon repressor